MFTNYGFIGIVIALFIATGIISLTNRDFAAGFILIVIGLGLAYQTFKIKKKEN